MKKTAAADFVLAMQEKSYRAADNNEIAAREKYRNDGYEPDEPDDDPSVVVNNTFHVDGRSLSMKPLRRRKKRSQRNKKREHSQKEGNIMEDWYIADQKGRNDPRNSVCILKGILLFRQGRRCIRRLRLPDGATCTKIQGSMEIRSFQQW